MIEERLEEFSKHVEIINDKYAEYVNKEKGLRYVLNTPSLLCRVDRLKLDTNELTVAKFKQQIENKDYELVDITKLVPKSEVTKDDKDKFTLVDKQTKGVILYNVTNQIGIHNTYTSLEQAFELCENINKETFGALCR